MSLPAANASSSTSSLDVIRPLSRDPISKKLKRQRETYSLQVRAFLDAADEVDIDQDVATDILEGFEGDINDDEGNEVDVEADGELSTNTAIYSEDDDDNDNGWKVGDDDEDPESDAQEEEVLNAWTHQEVRGMMHHLKERGMSSFIKEYVLVRDIPVVKLLYAFGVCLCEELRTKRPKTMLYFLKVALSRELQRREKLPNYNTIEDAVSLIRQSRRIVILTGAGISVSCGIPDFRSQNGIYASLKQNGEYELDDPQQMFDIQYFKENPSVFYSFARQIYPSNFIPSPCHRFIKLVEDKNQLLRNYTQNIDTLETLAGVSRVLQCHGSFATASCINCHRQVPGSEIENDIQSQKVPVCSACNATSKQARLSLKSKRKGKKKDGWDSAESDESDEPDFPPGIMKPDITFFGEKLTDNFDQALFEDREKVDLLLVIGTSLNVAPVADVVSHLPHSVPQILINKTPVRHINPDIVLLGNADDIVLFLCNELHWELPRRPLSSMPVSSQSHLAPRPANLKKRPSAEIFDPQKPARVGDSHVWLFEGAEGGRWVQQLEESMRIDAEDVPTTRVSSDAVNDSGRLNKKLRVD